MWKLVETQTIIATHAQTIPNFLMGASLSEPQVCEFCLSVYLSISVCLLVCTFITQQFTNVMLIYGVPSTVDCSFEDDVFCTVFVSTNTL